MKYDEKEWRSSEIWNQLRRMRLRLSRTVRNYRCYNIAINGGLLKYSLIGSLMLERMESSEIW